MKLFEPEDARECARALLAWFETAMRPLPWRKSYHPYEVWISEVMLQQTQMERGVRYFQRWMERFPDVAAVAAAPEEDILHAWEGLGYYRRARFVQAAAKAMMERHGGNIPDDEKALAALPGLGPYTVAAILSIAFNRDTLCVDANVERVFARLLDLNESPRRKNAARIIREQAMLVLPRGRARLYNQALMELGALICGKAPGCPECPVSRFCESRRRGVERERPVLTEKAATIDVSGAYGVLVREGRAFLVKRPEGGLWGGLWEFPGTLRAPGEAPESAVRRVFHEGFGIRIVVAAPLGSIRHNYTNHRLEAAFFRVDCEEEDWKVLLESGKGTALPLADIRTVAMPAHHRKLAARYFEKKGRITAEQFSLIKSC